MKTLVFCVKGKLPCHKTPYLPVFVSIYVEYMYICIYMCIMNLQVRVGEYLFYVFSLLFGIDADYFIMFISHTRV